jgi:hypothetical protein
MAAVPPPQAQVQAQHPVQHQQHAGQQEFLLLNPSLDANAVVNVRAAPSGSADVVGTISHSSGPVPVSAFDGDWAKLEGPEEAWVLRLLPDGG